jgi:hypothetical protein
LIFSLLRAYFLLPCAAWPKSGKCARRFATIFNQQLAFRANCAAFASSISSISSLALSVLTLFCSCSSLAPSLSLFAQRAYICHARFGILGAFFLRVAPREVYFRFSLLSDFVFFANSFDAFLLGALVFLRF